MREGGGGGQVTVNFVSSDAKAGLGRILILRVS